MASDVSEWELRMGGDENTRRLLLRVSEDLTRQRKPTQGGNRSSRRHQTSPSQSTGRGRLLAPVSGVSTRTSTPTPITRSRPTRSRRPSASQNRRLEHAALQQMLLQQQQQQQQEVYPLPEEDAAPPPILVQHLDTSMGETGTTTLPYFIGGRTIQLNGSYALSWGRSTTVSRALASMATGGIHPRPPSHPPGQQARMSVLIPIHGPDGEEDFEHIGFWAVVDDSLGGGNDYCIGRQVWDRINAVRPGFGLEAEPKEPAPFDVANRGGPTAAMAQVATPPPTTINNDGNNNTAYTHGMGPGPYQPPAGTLGFDMGFMDYPVVFPNAPPGPPTTAADWTADGSYTQQPNDQTADATNTIFNDMMVGAYNNHQGYSPNIRLREDFLWRYPPNRG